MADKPRIAFYVPALRVGGAQRVTITIAAGLAERGYEVDLLVSHCEGELLSEVPEGVGIVDLETLSIPGIGILASVPRLRSYLERVEPSVLFAAMTFANVVSILAGLSADTTTKIVATEHNTFGMNRGLKPRATYGLARHLYPFAAGVVAVSAGVADSVAKDTRIDRRDVTVLYNPVPIAEVEAESKASIDEPWLESEALETIVSVGRLEVPKDPETLLRAFARLNRVRPDTRLIVVGQGPKREGLVALAESLGVGDVVSVPGYVENAYAYMGHASTFVLSSRYEGLPTVLIEALACGCPVVATDCPSGPGEILADGKYGRLVPVGDEAALCEAIEATLKAPIDAGTLTERAKDFAVETVVDRYVEFIERTIASE